jgi:hypothetical protein
MPHLLRDLGVSRFFIQVIGIRGNPAKQADGASLQLAREVWEEIVPFTATLAAELGMVCHYPKVFLRPEEEFQCAGVVAENYFVFPNGRVYTCPLCEDYPLHSFEIRNDRLEPRPPVTESDLYHLDIPEGCVMNKILHPGNIPYGPDGRPLVKVACCMLKNEVRPGQEGPGPRL